MKSDFPVSLITGSSNHLVADSPEALAISIALLIEENEVLRRLAALLSSQLDFAPDLGATQRQYS